MVEALFLSVDPYMRPYSARLLQEGTSTMIGSQVAKYKNLVAYFRNLQLINKNNSVSNFRVIATKNGEYPLGTRLVGYWGW